MPLSRTNDVPSAAEGQRASVDDTTLKFDVSYNFSERFFGFAQWSQGFREPRFQSPLRPEYFNSDGLVEFRDGIPRRVTEDLLAPDTVDNYEVGIKFQSSDGWLQGSLTAFLIDWQGIPIVPSITTFLGAAIYFNAGEARSEGLEFELSAEVMDDLFVELSGSWVDSTLTEAQPGLDDKGADLPGSADYNVKAALEKRFFVGDRESFVRAGYTYVGEYFTLFQAGTAILTEVATQQRTGRLSNLERRNSFNQRAGGQFILPNLDKTGVTFMLPLIEQALF